ncbi:MAG: cytosol nonspecific dipeptidase [Candidatus Aminicenantes bacterium]|nr:MAG: cytosol nonspecific dipeptidase [Candidatus Aminicenantes bacterium]
MNDVFKDLKPALLWKHFARILEIPHCSGNEKALGDYIISVAEAKGLEWQRDAVGNVVVRKQATPGHEQAEGVILQGHLDMVCEKNSDIEHDFSRDPIRPVRQGDWIQAQGTTLGSDNGIGVAAALAVMEDDSLMHGPLEFLFTVDEETGLTGATKLEPGFLKGKKLFNLDSEDEGVFTIGCAGGADSEIIFPFQRSPKDSPSAWKIKIFGLRGGHSGIDINQGRGNAIKILARLLWEISQEIPVHLVRIDGGNKRNAIPREAWAECIISPAEESKFKQLLEEYFQAIKNELKSVEGNLEYNLESASPTFPALEENCQQALLNFLLALPHGVISMHPEIDGLVETSTNLAIIKTREKEAEIIESSRSSVASALRSVREVIQACCELAGAQVNQPEGYPGWTPNLESPLLQTMKKVYQQLFGRAPEVGAVHAGLECGIIGEKFPGMDMISFGPTIEHPHSPEERVHVESVEKFWQLLTAVIQRLA